MVKFEKLKRESSKERRLRKVIADIESVDIGVSDKVWADLMEKRFDVVREHLIEHTDFFGYNYLADRLK